MIIKRDGWGELYLETLWNERKSAELNSDIINMCGSARIRSGAWFFPEIETVSLKLIANKYDIEIDSNITESIKLRCEFENSIVRIQKGMHEEIVVPNFRKKLMPFQETGVAFLRFLHRALLCDTMGLGKTIEALATTHLCSLYPCLVICPASAVHVWADEASECISSPVGINIPTSNLPYIDTGINIVTYGQLKNLRTQIGNLSPASIWIDESHYCKNGDSVRTKLVTEICRANEASKIVAMTGTALPNRPRELETQLSMLGIIDLYGGPRNYLNSYCIDGETGSYSGGKSLKQLRRTLVRNCMIRRVKSKVLNLPPPTNMTIKCVGDPDIMREYKLAERNFAQWLKSEASDIATKYGVSLKQAVKTKEWRQKQGHQIMKTTKLKELIAIAKIPEAIEFIENFLTSSEDEQIVIFAHHKSVVSKIAGKFGFLKIDGSTPAIDRKKIADDFIAGETLGIVVSMKCAVSLSLQSAATALVIELPWVPADLAQAVDRIRRIGQTAQVVAYHMIANGTIDDRVIELLLEKKKMIDAVMDGKEQNEKEIHSSLFGVIAESLVLNGE